MTGHSVDYPELVEAIERLPVHSHLCLLYETREEQFAAVVPFMRYGLAKGDRCVYIADENTAAEVLRAMREGGVDVDSALDTGALAVITKREAYLGEGSFDPDAMIMLLRSTTDAAKADGFPALRVTGEMTWALGDEPGVGRLIEYEAKLNYVLPTCDILAICQYNLRRFPPEIIHDVIYTHPLVIVGGEVYENFYYIPPDIFLASDRASSEVEYLLSNLRTHTQDRVSLRQANRDLELTAKQLRKLNRVLRMISGVNETLIRATDEMGLLQEAIGIMADVGGYRMAWVGFAEHDEAKTVRPVCAAGYVEGYLDAVKITWSDTDLGQGPTGTAIRTGEPAFSRDILADPLFGPWRQEAAKRGYASSIAIPLIADGQVLGAINLIAGKLDAFETEEVELMKELASDMGYGIVTLRAREQLRQVEEHKHDFYRRTILAATEGKLLMCEPEEIWEIAGPPIASREVSHPRDVSVIRRMVTEVAESAGIDESRAHGLALCVGEATTNAIKHAGGGMASIHKLADSLLFVVSDKGHGIAAINLPEVALKKGYTTALSLGLGYKAMISIADQVYLATGPEGTTVGIEMKLHPQPTLSFLASLPDTWAS
ncbi:MAG: MEDS domain-containing protein [Armatimonadetes bacterium]|nr:MEDS domain-containing protein [Armatimonadota bacterium]